MGSPAPAMAPEIHVIPDQFYGAALKTKLTTAAKESSGTPAGEGAPSKSKLPILIGVVVFLLVAGIGGFFVYQNRDSLFGKPAVTPPPPPVVVATSTPEPPPPPPPPPSAPSDLVATASNPSSVSLTWTDTANNESAYRVERRTADKTIYERVTDMPANSTIFQDGSVQASSTYFYRIIARNDVGESAPSNEAMVSTPALPPPPPKQEPLPPAGLDTDSDGLTDLEEGIFGSDARNPDTDGDGFLDGNEVFNLYNPAGRAPAKLLGSGLVKEASGSIGWSMFIPTAWTITMDKTDGAEATIATGHGEAFKLTIERNDDGLAVLDWFLKNNPDADKTRIMQFKSKGGYDGIIGPDLLTTYIPWGNRIFVFHYDMAKQPFINYRTVYSMMMNSLQLKGLPVEMVPSGTGQLPFEPAATKPGTITEPVSVISATPTESATEAPADMTQPANTPPPPVTSTSTL